MAATGSIPPFPTFEGLFDINRRRELTEEEQKELEVGTLVRVNPEALEAWVFADTYSQHEQKIRGLILKKTSSPHIYLVVWNDGTNPVLEYREDLEVLSKPGESD